MEGRTNNPGDKHPEEWRADLNPDAMAGQNVGLPGAEAEQNAPTAYDMKDVHRQFHGFTDEDLKRIPVLPCGARLQQGATYVDLMDEQLREFTAMGYMEAGPNNWYVPKSAVDYPLWNQLIGIDNPERTDEADDSAGRAREA